MNKTIFSSQTKDKIIKLLYASPGKQYHMRQIERLVGERINSVREALLFLVKDGFLNQEKIGRKILFQANANNLFYDELIRMVGKQDGLGQRIIKEKQRLGKIKAAFLTSNFYLATNRKQDEIDLFVVGTISMAELAKICAEEGKKLGWEINYSVMTLEELGFRQKNKDPFLNKILQKNRLFLIGKEEYLF
ncbi:hypothetical protein A2313_03465 [Candidatus Roizmanbacteria bacterium RIFOXYB2_FULL_41_10]|uniref:HTH arsR-type domain-containing protein n=1 Tax=Candidatus Roizmanbacteria bacterium RIFOXYA1_FULL_41_12 TaxID=1802082 RepID=A0A1F7KGQ0_9BACT|nr:MAG: hypothetical protein A2262_01075 [Candidatus Roizmanbacteria bacterium RIFOXYA2_FULL_41_8]OGK67053.1 MAG: hypothetical protein A2209_03300 [Candidatus Roizmanbacteria bacterium RIFOXYA1_FULL_41_12]OGK72141.1 MAG: hypothetical protein A2313_03465 [Candidatus Roizmanbacteria bacterium RIFOXYB2_FULL_41_10]OGK74916.1 MAG: hypothetical protein A2575_03980 [Candidatus Roizmanbacteria bacterium RIFOXYD1_FULL_41_24]